MNLYRNIHDLSNTESSCVGIQYESINYRKKKVP